MKLPMKKNYFPVLLCLILVSLVCISLLISENKSQAALSFTQTGLPTPSSDIVIYAASSANIIGNGWQRVSDSSAAGGNVLQSLNNNAAKRTTAVAQPTSYIEISFNAIAGTPYRIWMRGKALNNDPANDSVHIQFNKSVDTTGQPAFRIGTTASTIYNLEDYYQTGLSGWGWQDNGWGVGVFGSTIQFASGGVQTMRVQIREDGLGIDQIVLSPQNYLNIAPGLLINDTVILPMSNQPPQVSASITSQAPAYAPSTVNFTASASDPDGTIVSYQWNFGDGGTSTQQNPSRVYTAPGTYTATVTVKDNSGATASTTKTVTVANPPGTPVRWTLVTYNIYRGRGTDNITDLNRTAATIASANPDVVTLSEVITNTTGEQANTLAALLQQRTGATWYIHLANEDPARAFVSNVILSKWPMVSKSTKFLDIWGSAAQATINIQGKLVNVFATHLWWQTADTQKRLYQISNLKPWAATFAEPRVIAGDFNYQPNTPEYLEMLLTYKDVWNDARLAGLATAYPDNPVTISTRTRRSRLDHAYVSGSTIGIMGASIPDTRDLSNTNVQILLGNLDDRGVRPSDHNMLVTRYELR